MLQAVVNEEKLMEWCDKLPELDIFLEFFFSNNDRKSLDYTCAEYFRTIEKRDTLRPYQQQLTQAFAEIIEPEYKISN